MDRAIKPAATEREIPMPNITIRCSECGGLEVVSEKEAARMEGPFLCSTDCEERVAARSADERPDDETEEEMERIADRLVEMDIYTR